MQVVLGARPSASVGPSTDVDARVHVSRSAMADFLRGQLQDDERFALLSGDEDARVALLHALGIVGAER
jgi:hypothetical protein